MRQVRCQIKAGTQGHMPTIHKQVAELTRLRFALRTAIHNAAGLSTRTRTMATLGP